jgi:hypothetical protein
MKRSAQRVFKAYFLIMAVVVISAVTHGDLGIGRLFGDGSTFLGIGTHVPRAGAGQRVLTTRRGKHIVHATGRLLPPIGQEADEEKHVFISLQGYDMRTKLRGCSKEAIFLSSFVAV